MKMKKTLAFIAALSMLSITGINAFAEEAVVTEVEKEPTEVVETETETATEESSTDIVEESESEIEASEEDSEIDSVTEDTTITKNVAILSGETFTIGDESFTASIEDVFDLKIYNNDRGLAFSTRLVYYSDISIALSVNGNILTITQYDDCNRLENTASFEYNAATGLFGNGKDNSIYSNYEECDFEFAGKSFTAVRTSEGKKNSEGLYDVYYYLSIYFADGTPTSIQNELVDCVYNKTTGYTRSVMSYIIIEDDKLIIRRIIESVDSSKDILTTYVLDKDTNNLVKSGSTSDTKEVTEQMLLDKFTAQYGEPMEYESGDFNNDGVLDMYCSIYKDGKNETYFVTMDRIILAMSNDTSIGGSAESYIYFKTSDGKQFRFTLYHRGAAFYVMASCSIEKINNDGTMTSVNINGSEYVSVLYDEYFNDSSIGDTVCEYKNAIAESQLFEPSTYFSSNGDGITINRYVYDGEDSGVGSTNYTYDAAANAFVLAASSNNGSTNNSGNSSNGSTAGTSNSPATSDNFSVIPFTLTFVLTAGAAAVVGIKNRRKK